MKGPQLIVILAVCVLILLGSIVLLMSNANGGSVDGLTGMVFDAFGVTPGSYGGWLVLLIGGGFLVIVLAGTVSLVRYAIGLFRE